MNRLIADAKAKKFDIILAKELSRLARNQRLALEIKEVIEKHHIHLVTLDGAIDTTTGNTHMFGLFAWIYEQEAQRTSERIKMALEIKAKKGQFKGSIPPYGYVAREGKLYISDDGSSEIVKRIFQRYIEGKGFDAIARELFLGKVYQHHQCVQTRRNRRFIGTAHPFVKFLRIRTIQGIWCKDGKVQ